MDSFIGSRHLTIIDRQKNFSFPLLLMYPSKLPSQKIRLGPFSINATPDAAVKDGKYPLIIISHGTGGNHLGYLSIAQYLAEQGYIVAMLEHYGNNHNNNALEGTVDNLEARPRHISLVIDMLISDPQLQNHVQQSNVVIIGHSIGGYTALAVAGGEPWSENGEKIEISRDNRVIALVLLAPATEWYIPDRSLSKITVPILMLTAEHDQPLPSGWHKKCSDIVIKQLIDKTKITLRVVDNSNHFSFLSPFPLSMRNPHFLPSIDPEGFNREEFHQVLNLEIHEFISNVLLNSEH